MKCQAVSVTHYVLIPEEEYKRLLPSPPMEHNVPTHSNDGDDEDSADNDKKELNRILETRNMPDDEKKELYFNEKQKIWAKQKLSEASSRKEIFVPVNDLKIELLKSVTVSYHHKVLALFQFFKENPSFLKMSMMGEAVIHGERIISSSVYRLLDFLFHN